VKAKDNAGALRAIALHTTTYGHAPVGVWSAPGRVNLIGEHTDYNEGFVLPMAIDHRTFVAVGFCNTPSVEVVSESLPGVMTLALDALEKTAMTGWSGYALGVIWAMAEAGIDVSTRQGLSIAVASDVPLGAGLSSSAALECSVALALNDVWGLSLSRSELAALGQKAENEVVGANTGMMDQMASMFALENHAVFLDCRVGEVQSIPLSLGDLGIVVMDTMVSHQLAHSQYGARRASCEKAAEFFGVSALRDVTPAAIEGARGVLDEETLRRARHIVSENQRVLGAVEALGNGNLVGFGILLNQSHESMRDDFEISSPELDLAVACARDVGALGARMTGGGFGGSAIALLRADQMETLASTLTREFTGKSFAVPQPVWVSASTGARKEPDPER